MWILHYAKANFLLSFSIEFAILLFIYIIYIYIKIPEKCLYRLRSIHHRVPLVSFIIFLSLSPIFSLPRVFAARCRHWWSTWSRIRGIQKYQIVLIPTPSLFLFCFLKIVFLSRKSPFVFFWVQWPIDCQNQTRPELIGWFSSFSKVAKKISILKGDNQMLKVRFSFNLCVEMEKQSCWLHQMARTHVFRIAVPHTPDNDCFFF